MKLLYFASLRERLKISEELLTVDEQTQTVEQLLTQLQKRGQIWQDTLNAQKVKVAINQEIVDINQKLSDTDEIAFFPPVTGG